MFYIFPDHLGRIGHPLNTMRMSRCPQCSLQIFLVVGSLLASLGVLTQPYRLPTILAVGKVASQNCFIKKCYTENLVERLVFENIILGCVAQMSPLHILTVLILFGLHILASISTACLGAKLNREFLKV